MDHYRAQCLRCHIRQSCRAQPAARQATTPPDDCLACHMPKRTVTTIAHAALTDHSIPARPSADVQPSARRNQKPELLLLTAHPQDWNRLDTVPPSVLFQAYDSLIGEGHQEFEPLLQQILPQVAAAPHARPPVLRALARAEFRRNTSDGNRKALDYMKQVFRAGDPNVDDYLFLANLYTRTTQPKEAVAILEKARTASPYFREIYENLAAAYMELGQYGDALKVLGKGMELFPDDATLRALQKKANSATLTGP